ncbi:MAG TPA: 30S ribosomal protein S7 [archaeon]|jgi:small subunit ribosomal protein S7|nr:30S ribosomal protein S7 [archaeon]HRT03393.1 30S ribosomal protein S7 [Candidatus Diapherotrites archaeon]
MLVFGKWNTQDVKCNDLGLAKYMGFQEKEIPHTFGVSKSTPTGKAKKSVVERLVNKLMRSGQGKKKLSGKYLRGRNGCGKKELMLKSVDEAFDYIYKVTKENPIQILVRAIENSAPREDTIRIKKGGVMHTQAVDVAPIKRLDEALKNISLAVFSKTYGTKIGISKALAEELIAAAKNDPKSYALKRKDEIERIAMGSR